MHSRVEDRRIRYAAFVLLAVSINAVDSALTRLIPDPGKRTLVAAAASLGISLYGMIWLAGLARSLELGPVLIGPESLDLRYGLLFALRVPREMITSFRPADFTGPLHAFVLPRRSQPDFYIDQARPLEAEGLFGVRRRVSLIALAPDDSAGFEQALREFLS